MTENLKLEIEGLEKRFGEVEAIRDLSLSIEGPRVFGVVGPDGAGKTTLLRILAGLLAFEGGSVRVLGVDPLREAARLKPLLGYVPQAFSMYPTLTVEENLAFVARCHRVPRREYEARRHDLLRLARLAKFADARAETLSGGMKQKLALCGALLPRPRLIILDEPTTGVDVLARAEFWETIREEARAALVIVATSYLDEADRCDQILYMLGGREIAIGSPREIREAAGVRVYRLGVPPGREAEAARVLAEDRALKRVEATPRGVRVETELGEQALAARVAVLGLRLGGEVRIEELAPDLETALLDLEERARKMQASRPSAIRRAYQEKSWWSR
jgi:ABC-2 type transport system ATP-binding protein